MKYIILQKIRDGITRTYPVVFSEQFVHSEVAKQMIHMHFRTHNEELTVRSAGFCLPHERQLVCSRGSESLKIPNGTPADDRNDTEVVNLPNAFMGMVPS